MSDPQSQVDRRNAAFWDELCGTTLAAQLGISDASPESLERFDAAYLAMYPYLDGYLPQANGSAERLLEIGLGYGTVSQMLAERGFDYHGLDIAEGPVAMVRDRLARLGIDGADERVLRDSALAIPHPNESFDYVVAIGCLHHTGDMAAAVREVRRVLRPGGRAVVMVYNRRSYRRLGFALKELPRRIRGRGRDEEALRGSYDTNLEGSAAPATEYASRGEAKRRLFKDFERVETKTENFEALVGIHAFVQRHRPLRALAARANRQLFIERERLLGWPAHRVGLDLYITATK